jgi:acetyl esterase/lipase
MFSCMKTGVRLTVAIAVALCSWRSVGDEVRVHRDVAYLGPDRAEKLDLYLPGTIEEGQRLPAVVIIHGGGWFGGDKAAKREQNIGTNLARAGYVCASINYLLAEKEDENPVMRLATVWPQNLHDCKTAVRFLRKNAAGYHIDPDHIGAIGGSAGGHLTAMLGLTGPDDDLDPKGHYGEFSCRVQAIVPMYGPHDLMAGARDRNLVHAMTDEQRGFCVAASPVTYASKNDPPTLILHGTADRTVPIRQSELLADALRKARVPAELVIVEGAPHSFHLQPNGRDLRPLVIEFFDKHLK